MKAVRFLVMVLSLGCNVDEAGNKAGDTPQETSKEPKDANRFLYRQWRQDSAMNGLRARWGEMESAAICQEVADLYNTARTGYPYTFLCAEPPR